MTFTIRMGEPEIKALWDDLFKRKASGELNADEDEFFGKWVKTTNFLSQNPRHPSLSTHEISDLSEKFGVKVFEAYLENRTPGARRMFWAYGPGKGDITILSVERHPNDDKKHAYKKIKLSSFPKPVGTVVMVRRPR